MALAGGEPRPAERHALVQRHVLADLRRLPHHDAHAVVDEEAVADVGGRMDLDAGHRPGRGRDGPGRERQTGLAEGVRDAVREERMDPGPHREDLEGGDAAGGGVAGMGGGDVALQLPRHPRDGADPDHALQRGTRGNGAGVHARPTSPLTLYFVAWITWPSSTVEP